MNAVIYARYSSDSQREESIDDQIKECMNYAERTGVKNTKFEHNINISLINSCITLYTDIMH